MKKLAFVLALTCSLIVRAEPCEMIDDAGGFRYLECDPEKAKAAKEAAALAKAKAGPPRKPGWAQSVEEFKANMEADAAKTDAERAAARSRTEASAAQTSNVENSPAPQSASPTPSSMGGTEYVKGYYRKDGTYVRPHTRRR